MPPLLLDYMIVIAEYVFLYVLATIKNARKHVQENMGDLVQSIVLSEPQIERYFSIFFNCIKY